VLFVLFRVLFSPPGFAGRRLFLRSVAAIYGVVRLRPATCNLERHLGHAIRVFAGSKEQRFIDDLAVSSRIRPPCHLILKFACQHEREMSRFFSPGHLRRHIA
jgi:hypothetical protein